MQFRLPSGATVAGSVLVDPITELPYAAGAGSQGAAVSIGDGADVTAGAKADARAAWYDAVATRMSLLKLLIAATLDAGSHAYGYDGSGNLVTDAWTFLGATHTKTYTWISGRMTAESDWV